jgi:hypothetical protein
MPRTNGQATRKTRAPATSPPRATSRRRAPQAPQETPASAVRGPDVPAGLPTILPAPALPENLPAHETLMPAPPDTPYSLPAPPGADDPGVAPRLEPPLAALSPALAAELTAVWPVLQSLLAWWQERQSLAQQGDAPGRTLARQTYHVEQRSIEAVKREADRTGDSDAAIVNRAFARYFAGRDPSVSLGGEGETVGLHGQHHAKPGP